MTAAVVTVIVRDRSNALTRRPNSVLELMLIET